jgi:hypothetical protein
VKFLKGVEGRRYVELCLRGTVCRHWFRGVGIGGRGRSIIRGGFSSEEAVLIAGMNGHVGKDYSETDGFGWKSLVSFIVCCEADGQRPAPESSLLLK